MPNFKQGGKGFKMKGFSGFFGDAGKGKGSGSKPQSQNKDLPEYRPQSSKDQEKPLHEVADRYEGIGDTNNPEYKKTKKTLEEGYSKDSPMKKDSGIKGKGKKGGKPRPPKPRVPDGPPRPPRPPKPRPPKPRIPDGPYRPPAREGGVKKKTSPMKVGIIKAIPDDHIEAAEKTAGKRGQDFKTYQDY